MGGASPDTSASDLQPPACDTVTLIRDNIKAKVIGRSLCQRASQNRVGWVTENSANSGDTYSSQHMV